MEDLQHVQHLMFHNNPGIHRQGTFAFCIDCDWIDINFPDQGKVHHHLGEPHQQILYGFRVRGFFSPSARQDLVSPNLGDHTVGLFMVDGGDAPYGRDQTGEG